MTGGGQTTTYAYDSNNNMIRATSSEGVSTYTYDGGGTLLAQTINGVVTKYLVDTAGSLSQILALTDASGNVTAVFTVSTM